MHSCIVFSVRRTSFPLIYYGNLPLRFQLWLTSEKHSSAGFFLPGRWPSPLVLLVIILLEVNSWLGPLSSDTFFARIGYDGYMALDCCLDSGSSGAEFTVTSFSCDKFFAQIIHDAPETTNWGAVPAAPHSQWRHFLVKTFMPELEIMQGSKPHYYLPTQ